MFLEAVLYNLLMDVHLTSIVDPIDAFGTVYNLLTRYGFNIYDSVTMCADIRGIIDRVSNGGSFRPSEAYTELESVLNRGGFIVAGKTL